MAGQLIDVLGGPLEYQRIPGAPSMPTLVFLHDGLGAVSTWGRFASALCEHLCAPGLLYSRAGYGRSAPPRRPWPADYLHEEALQRLPALLAALGVERPYLFGHSDGASIALLHGARHPVTGMTVVAPHVFVEPITVLGVRALQAAWRDPELRARLERHHQRAESTFFDWSNTWLDPAFAAWDIRRDLEALSCPVLALQGTLDAFGTMAQIRAIARAASACTAIELGACGHAPHKEKTSAVIGLVAAHYHAARALRPAAGAEGRRT